MVEPEADDGEIGFVSLRITGTLRLLAGMVRANRPGRALLGLSKLLVAAFGTAAIALTTNTIWQMGDALDGARGHADHAAQPRRPGRVADHRARPLGEGVQHTPRELARLFNLGTGLTLGLAACVSYLVLFAGTATVAALLIDSSVLSQNLGRPVGPADYAVLAGSSPRWPRWAAPSAPASRTRTTSRAAAYGYHPTPTGWRDDTASNDSRPSGS